MRSSSAAAANGGGGGGGGGGGDSSSYSVFCDKEILYFGFLCCATIAVLVTQVRHKKKKNQQLSV